MIFKPMDIDWEPLADIMQTLFWFEVAERRLTSTAQIGKEKSCQTINLLP